MSDSKIEKALSEVRELCNGKKWHMSIPVNNATDSDCVIIDGIAAARAEGYREGEREGAAKALEDVRTVIREAEKRAQESEDGYLVDVDRIVRDIEELQSAYEKGSDGNGKAE